MKEVSTARAKAPPKLFYGWVVTFATAVSYFLIAGARQGGFGNFLKPISTEFGWSRALTAGAASLGSVESAIQGPILGILVDRLGSRLIMWLGFAIGAAGLVVLGFINSLALFYLVYVVMVPLGLGAVQLAGQTVVAHWFIKRRSRALSIITVGFSLGGAFLTPAIGWMVSNYGWRSTSVVMGIVMGVVGLSVVSLVKNDPEKYGYSPDGSPQSKPAEPDKQEGSAKNRASEEVDFSLRQALKTSSFWLLVLAMSLSGLATSAVSVHAIPLLTDKGFSAQAAANFVGLSFLWGVVGRVMWGFLGDYVAKRYLLAVAVVVMGTGIVFLATSTHTFEIYLYSFLYGIGQGVVPVQFAIRAEYFGRKAFGSIAGVMTAFTTVGGLIGPIYAGFVYDHAGSYRTALLVVALACLVSCVLFWFARRPVPPISTELSMV